jgi:hypothetical protein
MPPNMAQLSVGLQSQIVARTKQFVQRSHATPAKSTGPTMRAGVVLLAHVVLGIKVNVAWTTPPSAVGLSVWVPAAATQ